MKRIHWMFIIAALGLVILGIGQRLSLPDFYGTTAYSAHAHLMVGGVLLFVGALLTDLCWRVVTSRSQPIRRAGRRQLLILGGVTLVAGLYRLSTKTQDYFLPEGSSSTLPDPGGASRGALVLWVLLVIVGTLINLAVLAAQASEARRDHHS